MRKIVLHVLDSMTPEPGHPNCVLPGLFDEQAQRGWECRIIHDQNVDDFEKELVGVPIIHIHGLWNATSKRIWPVLKKTDKNYLISTYGMHLPGGQLGGRLQRFKEDISYQDSLVKKAWCLHTLTTEENDYMKGRGYNRRAKPIPLGIDPALFDQHQPDDSAESATAFKTMLYVGSMSDTVCIDMLIGAFAKIVAPAQTHQLVLAGVGSNKDADYARRGAQKASIADHVSVHLNPEYSAMLTMFRNTVLVLYPIAHPCSPITALLALASGKPIVIGKSTHIPEIGLAKAGWEITSSQKALCHVLEEVLSTSENELQARGQRARELATSRYTWARITPEYLNLYSRIMGRP